MVSTVALLCSRHRAEAALPTPLPGYCFSMWLACSERLVSGSQSHNWHHYKPFCHWVMRVTVSTL